MEEQAGTGKHASYSLLHAHDLPGKVAISIDEHARQRRLGIIGNAVVEHDAHKLGRSELGGQLPEHCLQGKRVTCAAAARIRAAAPVASRKFRGQA